jgi:hypothetical protein
MKSSLVSRLFLLSISDPYIYLGSSKVLKGEILELGYYQKNSLGPHFLVKSQRFTLICVGKSPRVHHPLGLVEVRTKPGYQKKKKKLLKQNLSPIKSDFVFAKRQIL